jgi:RNA-dependent RNA polymerase
MFFEEDAEWSVVKLRAHFGDLMSVFEEYGAGKWAARLGLSFSSTAAFGYIEPYRVVQIPDVLAADGSISTDGCGLIKDNLALRISREMCLPEDTCVFQIRLGGTKGVLTRMPDDIFERICVRARVATSATAEIAYRPSMKKYHDGPSILEIQNVSQSPRFSGARLNKCFILILLTRGIPLETFEDLLQAQVEALAAILYDREAAKFFVDGELDSQGEGFDQDLYEMLLAGQDMDEPQVQTKLRRCQKRYFDKLRNKLSITVKDSAYLFGVADPLGVLKEGEVYVNLPSRGGPQIGEFVVGRNPAYATSDLRVLNGVNVRELNHLTNCIGTASRKLQ